MGKVKYWLPTLAWMGLIFGLSHQPTIKASQVYWQEFAIKKTAHFIEYGILAGLLYWSVRHTVNMPVKKILVLAWVLTVGYAMSDEYHQSFIPGREPRARDVVIDSIGAATAVGIIARAGKKS